MTVLFIDDESLIRKGLQAIIAWKDYGFDHYLEAEEGNEGLLLIQKYHPELVLLDIRLQDMDGITVCKQARESGFKGRIIIISGYSDFQYAQSALTYDVTAYLLKPVDPTDLTNAILKASEELERESLISIYANQSINHSISNILTDLITGRLKYSLDIALAYNLSFTSNQYYLIALHPLSNIDNNDSLKDFIQQIKSKFSYTVLIDNEIYLLVTSHADFSMYQQLKDNFLKKNTHNLFFIHSECIHHIDDLSRYYIQCVAIINSLFYYASADYTYLLTSVPGKIPATNAFNVLQHTQAIINAIITLNTPQADSLLLEYSSYLISRKSTIDTIGFILGNSYQQILTELVTSYPEMEIELPSYKVFLNKLCDYNFLFQYMAYFKTQIHRMISIIKEAENSNPCEKLCQYIESNYTSSIKLESLGEQFGYNSSYLGKLFKKQTGVSFNTYLDEVRIKHAKLYLSKNASVTQTAEKVGFTDIDYFTRKFKKYEGCAPSEYKKRVLEQKNIQA